MEETSKNVVTTTVRGSIGIITIDNPPVNALSHQVRASLQSALISLANNAAVAGIVIACAGKTFIAGADISEFGKTPQAPSLRDVVAAIDGLEKPTLAALHGTAYGGGLELALACRYRVAESSTKLGLPEVKLGLIPGAGGTVRLPYLVGPSAALQIISSGDPVPGVQALTLGLVDALFDSSLVEQAAEFLEQRLASGQPRPPVKQMRRYASIDLSSLDPEFDVVRRKAKGLEAPLACVDAIRNAMTMPFDQALAEERRVFDALMAGTQSKALRHLFFAERAAGKVENAMPKAVGKVGVIGAGTMGGGIAMAFVNAGIPVTVVDVDQAAIDRGLATISKNYDASVRRSSLQASDVSQRMGLLSWATDLQALADRDLVIEAAFEDMAVKKDLFGRLDRIVGRNTILATNTSYLDVDEIAASSRYPERVLGMHFFSPANVMKLLEVVRGKQTDQSTLATAVQLGKKIGKVAVVVGVCRGFVGNRMLGARGVDTTELLLEGATPSQIDKVFTDFGWPMGQFQMWDLAGLDIGWRNRQSLGQSLAVADELVALNRLGQKTGRGYYVYGAGGRVGTEDPEVLAMAEKAAAERRIVRRTIDETEILERTHYPLVNEGMRVLEEGIAQRSSDVDVVWVNGYGFPRAKGGPMFWAEGIGLGVIRDRLRYWYDRTGREAFNPSDLLLQKAREQAA